MNANGTAHKYGDNVDTDVIIPARYLNTSDPKELAEKCMCDIDADFVKKIKVNDIMVAGFNFGCGNSRFLFGVANPAVNMRRSPLRQAVFPV